MGWLGWPNKQQCFRRRAGREGRRLLELHRQLVLELPQGGQVLVEALAIVAAELVLETAWRTVAGDAIARRARASRVSRGVLELVVADERWIDLASWLPAAPPEVAEGLVPAGILTILLVGFHVLLRRRRGVSNGEATQTVAVFLMGVLAALTVTGIWFRGPGMALMWPWR